MQVRGFPIHFHIPHQVLHFPTPSDIGKTDFEVKKCKLSSNSQNSLVMFYGAMRHLARINDSDTKLKQICTTEDELIEEITQPKDFNTGVHLKYNKIFIGDDQTNNEKI